MVFLRDRSIQAVIFDMDGLIINNGHIYRQAYQAAARRLGYNLDDNLYSRFVGVPHEVCNQILVDSFGPDFPCEQFSSQVSEQYKYFIATSADIFHRGFGALLPWLKAHQIKLALATSSTLEQVKFHFQNSDYLELFDSIATTEDVTNPKPHPEIYHLSLDRLQTEPNQTIVLEDSNQGMRAAIAAGCLSIMVPSLAPPTPDVEKNAFMILENLTSVMELLEQQTKATVAV